MKKLIAILGMVMLLSPPAIALSADQTVPNGIQRTGGGVSLTDPVNVAVVDTGIDTTHPDLNVRGGVDCSPDVESFTPGALVFSVQDIPALRGVATGGLETANLPGYQDGHGHGTHVAGTIGALDNDFGVVGMAPGASLYAVRVLNSSGSGTAESIICGLEWIAEYHDLIGFDAVNMSLGLHFQGDVAPLFAPCNVDTTGNPTFVQEPALLAIQQAICDVTALGIPVVVAAGNDDGSASMNFPATLDNVITVSNFFDADGAAGARGENTACPEVGPNSLDDALWTHWNGSLRKEYSSSNGIDVDLSAPGTCVLSTVPGGYATLTGTSMASPHVAGLVALYRSACPDASYTAVRRWLASSGEPQAPSFHDTDSFAEPLAHYVAPAGCS
jgi:subtilisin